MLGDYLKIIQEKENLHGKQNEEVEKDILCRYFRKYKFQNREEAIKFFICWGVLPETPEAEPVLEYCVKMMSDKYNLDITIAGLLLEVKPRGKVYSYRNGEWHEGYDPFYGDTNHCYGDTLEEAIKSLYVKDTKHNWTQKKTDKIGLITHSCGYGKTHWVEHELVDEINDIAFVWNDLTQFTHYQKKDILFITTRRSIADQQLKSGKVVNVNEDDFSEEGLNPLWEEREDKVRIVSTAKLGSLYKEGKVKKMFPIVVIDELHSLFLDTMFSEESYSCIQCILHFWKDTIKVGLTATPDLLLKYIDPQGEMFYLLDDNDLLPKYNAKEVIYCNYTYLKSSLKLIEPREDNKAIVYCASAKSAINLAEKYDKAAYLISNYNKDTEAVEKQQPLYKYIIENAELPKEVNLLFMTSAYREGVEIKDSAVKNIIIDASDEITISQFIGRIRADLDKVIINTNQNQYDRIMKIAEEYAVIKGYTPADMAEYYGMQKAKLEKQDNVTLFIQKVGGQHELNKFIEPVQKYLLDCYIQANNRGHSQIVKNGGRDLTNSKDWFNSYLGKYSKSPIRGVVGKEDIAREGANWNVVNDYLGRRLGTAERQELAEAVNWHDKHGTKKWTSIKKELAARGFKLEEVKIKGKRYTIIK